MSSDGAAVVEEDIIGFDCLRDGVGGGRVGQPYRASLDVGCCVCAFWFASFYFCSHENPRCDRSSWIFSERSELLF